MNTEQNPSTPQGQEPEAADAVAPQQPRTPAASTPAAAARAAQVPAAGAEPAQAPEAQWPEAQAPEAQWPEAERTQQLPAQGPAAGREAAAVPPPAGGPATGRAFETGSWAAQGHAPADAGRQESRPAGHGPLSDTTTAFGNPYAAPATATTRRPDRRWVPVVSAAAVAALLASAGTAGAIALLDDDTQAVSLADVGRSDQQAVPVSSNGDAPDWQAVTSAVSDSVVSIQVATQQGEGEGSGVVIDADGHILTNNHVVSGAQQVQVTLADGRLFEAEVVGTDPATDLAVVRLTDAPEDLTAATLGDSDAVAVGDAVMAVGNPLGLANTATTGIVSALDRPVSASSQGGGDVVVTNAVQTDAAVNPGNSGGPLFNASGEVIGINSSILTLSSSTQQSGSIGLGFAIPSNLASSVSDQLIDDGSAEHAFLGVSLSDGTATADGVTRLGARVEEVVAGSPAEEAGLEAGDVVVAIGEDPVDGRESLTAFVREHAAGEEVTLTVVRDGDTRQVTTGLAVRDDQGLAEQDQNVPGQGGMPGQGDSDGSGSGSSDQTDPGNIPDWLRDLFGN
ncbi:S1C family serine protease [Myceligenerans xiligouense]|uniref:Putative serine protease PepD n=1 Tax=Myceligenerans xiligouense TaxID=253184 RepID=A0A3N4YQU1_9MICO|nr:trypsin-like peptidase domain-containing protein [Myceligenerans xiligouense]RPF22973.1 putative serine protease PepD [Myceligenerans xiligouense]